MNDIIHLIVTNPLVLGGIINVVLKNAHDALLALDKSGKLAPYSGQLHVAYLVMAFLTSAVSLASQGKLSEIDTNSLGQFAMYWFSVIIGGKALEPVVTPKQKK